MTEILVVRHGESSWNSVGRWQGQADPPLSPEGLAQARRAASKLGSVSGIVASDLSRAAQTAAILSESTGVGPVLIEPMLRERSIGPWQGLTTAEIERDYPGALNSGERPVGWESDETILERTLKALRRVATHFGGGNVVAVSHTGIIYAIERHLGANFRRIGHLHGRQVTVTPSGLNLGSRVALDDQTPEPSAQHLPPKVQQP